MNMVHYRELTFGDIVIYENSSRLIMVFFNSYTKSPMQLKEFPMIAQVTINEEIKILPIQFQWKQTDNKRGDKDGLSLLKLLFVNNALASQILNEAYSILVGKSWNYNLKTLLNVMYVKTPVPEIKVVYEDETKVDDEITNRCGKLLIVEKYFDEKTKKEYYRNIKLGKTERQSLVAIQRANPSLFSKILNRFNKDHLPTDIYRLRI